MLELAVESWIWYGFVLAFAIARFISRSLALGSFRNLQADDYVMMFALCTYTALTVTINFVTDYETNLLPPGYDVNTLTDQEKEERRTGSKLVLVVEQNQILTIWAVKACLLIMYYRLTLVRKENLAVVLLAVYVTFGFVFMEIFYFGVWCRPFHDYWAVPTSNPQCSAAIHHLITNAVLNLSSDLLTLALALQMFIRSKLPLKRKLVLCGIFGLGIFVILAAVLNKYYSFKEPFGSLWTFWYVRESSTAMIVANLPFLWTLLRRVFKLGSFENPNHSDNIRSTPSQSDRGGWLQRLRAQGRRFSPHVFHGVNISPNRSESSGITSHARSKKSRGSSRLQDSSDRPGSEEIALPQRTASQRDPEAQRQPWDEMDLGEFLTESNRGDYGQNNGLGASGTGNAAQRRRSWGGSQW